MLIFSPQTLQPELPQLSLWQWQFGVRKSLPLCWRWRGLALRLLSPGQHRWQSWLRPLCAEMRGGGYGAVHCPG